MNDPKSSGTNLTAFPKIEQLEFIQLLGEGASSSVYKARQQLLDRIVALKVLSSSLQLSDKAIKQFQQEAKICSELEHPSLVKTIGFGFTEDLRPYLVMEYLEGITLEKELEQNSLLSFARFKQIFLPLLDALDYAHKIGLVHRDIKPGNIMLVKNSDDNKVSIKLLDFGLAKLETQGLTKTGIQAGSPGYMSPEQIQGKAVDARSDIYALSCVMFQSLCGELPFSGDSILELMEKQITGRLPSTLELSKRLELPRQLSRLILSGLSKDPDNRPGSAREMAEKLTAILDDITLDRAPRAETKGKKRSILQQALPALLLISAILLCAKIFELVIHKNDNEQFHKIDGRVRELSAADYMQRANKAGSARSWFEALKNYRLAAAKLERSKDQRSFVEAIKGEATCTQLYTSALSPAGELRLLERTVEDIDKGIAAAKRTKVLASCPDLFINKVLFLARMKKENELVQYCNSLTADLMHLELNDRLQVWNVCADELVKFRKYDLAWSYLQKIISTTAADQSPDLRTEILQAKAKLSVLLKKQGRVKESERIALSTAKELCNDSFLGPAVRVEVLGTICGALIDKNRDTLEKILKEDLEKQKGSYAEDPLSASRVWHHLGIAQAVLNKKVIAMNSFEKARALLRHHEEDNSYARAWRRTLLQTCISTAKELKDPRLGTYIEELKQIELLDQKEQHYVDSSQ